MCITYIEILIYYSKTTNRNAITLVCYLAHAKTYGSDWLKLINRNTVSLVCYFAQTKTVIRLITLQIVTTAQNYLERTYWIL